MTTIYTEFAPCGCTGFAIDVDSGRFVMDNVHDDTILAVVDDRVQFATDLMADAIQWLDTSTRLARRAQRRKS